jgi:UDP-glucuronate 4-epimerase
MNILVTGGAGFIGSALSKKLNEDGHKIVVIDNFNDYYDPELKQARVESLLSDIEIFRGDITKKEDLEKVFSMYDFDVVCHLAAQAGVRYSVDCPEVYVQTNVLGTQLIFEAMKKHDVKRMVFASTSSAYGMSAESPFSEIESADRPVSVYAATKRSGELLAHSYFQQYGIETTCLRFFTVYGSWSRPDMAMLKFAQKMTKGEPIDIYNNGDLRRDFTHISDIVEGFVKAVETPLGYEIINLGNGHPIELIKFIELLESELGVTADKNFLPMQQGDVYETYADTKKAEKLLNFKAMISFEEGIKEFVSWYKTYFK